jgi:hypothetical protein
MVGPTDRSAPSGVGTKGDCGEAGDSAGIGDMGDTGDTGSSFITSGGVTARSGCSVHVRCWDELAQCVCVCHSVPCCDLVVCCGGDGVTGWATGLVVVLAGRFFCAVAGCLGFVCLLLCVFRWRSFGIGFGCNKLANWGI